MTLSPFFVVYCNRVCCIMFCCNKSIDIYAVLCYTKYTLRKKSLISL
nr:MAG TPA: hypothetical protein [Caudoviricetes sp.]